MIAIAFIEHVDPWVKIITGDITMLGGKAWWLRAPTVLGS